MSSAIIETALFLEVIYPVLNRLSQTNNPPQTREQRDLLINDLCTELLRNIDLFIASDRIRELTQSIHPVSQTEYQRCVRLMQENVKNRVTRHFPIRRG